jgi:hypothetical protein
MLREMTLSRQNSVSLEDRDVSKRPGVQALTKSLRATRKNAVRDLPMVPKCKIKNERGTFEGRRGAARTYLPWPDAEHWIE